jgi:hypothetical protein
VGVKAGASADTGRVKGMAARPEQSMVTAQVIERSFFRKWCFIGGSFRVMGILYHI